MPYRTIGSATVEWDKSDPFVFTISESSGPVGNKTSKIITIDLTYLHPGCEEEFLLNLRDYFVERRYKVTLNTIKSESQNFQVIFRKVIDWKLFDSKIRVIDESFLLCLGAVKNKMTSHDLSYLLRCFKANPYSPLFAKGLEPNDFPLVMNKKGRHGAQIDRILAKALNKAAVVHILNRCDAAYDANTMDIGHYSFVHLAFAIFCRPESYRQIQLDDLRFDTDTNKYFISVIPAKTRIHHPAKIVYQINEPLGILLTKQRQNVVTKYGHLVARKDILKLALFPARRLRADKSGWITDYSNRHFGMIETGAVFITSYPYAIKKQMDDEHFTLNANTLRHTIGTLLAQTGASAQTIQAVLKHATDTVCNAYVDIAFHGLARELSDAMHPAFISHIPAFERFNSRNDTIPLNKSIRSDNFETGQIEQTGECGKDIVCEFAPITCYGCFRFTPHWDADHSINVNIVQREIDDYSKRGKPFEHMVERARIAKNQILQVMHAADRYLDAVRKRDPS